ncbi:hypothetical protein SSX86_031168 [Deinandra increscens subsp. villosa]|uniref:Uncharacterized protein n=1 Tax=Deinandra increscens subsp. villosa TaxID=3103831 RepID=A0AAP0C9G1_9ASTR
MEDMDFIQYCHCRLRSQICSYFQRRGLDVSAGILEQEANLLNQDPPIDPDPQQLLEELWGIWADHYVPVPNYINCHQEMEPFIFPENGELLGANLRLAHLRAARRLLAASKQVGFGGFKKGFWKKKNGESSSAAAAKSLGSKVAGETLKSDSIARKMVGKAADVNAKAAVRVSQQYCGAGNAKTEKQLRHEATVVKNRFSALRNGMDLEDVSNGDGLLASFWIPCMIERGYMALGLHVPQDPVIPPIEPPFNLDEDNVIPPIEPLFHLDEDNFHPSVLDSPDFLFKHFLTVHKQQASFRILTCHFSTDGKYLAFAGTERRAFLWNVETRMVVITPDLPSIITDLRFKPECHMFAAACYDGIIRCWETASLTKPTALFRGHTLPVLSVDFSLKHPTIICSCDIDGEVRLWDIVSHQPLHQFQVGKGVKQLRLQSKGDVFAAVVGKQIMISIIREDEGGAANLNQANLEGHVSDVKSICWDNDGRFLASVCHDRARIWELINETWKCVHELDSNDFKFESCVFHPVHPQLLIIGSYTFVHIWDFSNGSKVRRVDMRTPGFIASLAASPAGFVALTNRSGEVNLWR